MSLVCHNFYNLICKKPNLHDVYVCFLTLYKFDVCPSFLCPPIVHRTSLEIVSAAKEPECTLPEHGLLFKNRNYWWQTTFLR
jgi:hypothetical protein